MCQSLFTYLSVFELLFIFFIFLAFWCCFALPPDHYSYALDFTSAFEAFHFISVFFSQVSVLLASFLHSGVSPITVSRRAFLSASWNDTRLSLITSFCVISHPSPSCYLKCLFLVPSFLLTIPAFTLDCRPLYRSVVSTSLFDHTSTSIARNAAWLQMLNNIWWTDASLLFSLLLNLICHSRRKLLLFKIVLLIFLTFENL